jgi:hypothetical protein
MRWFDDGRSKGANETMDEPASLMCSFSIWSGSAAVAMIMIP